MADTLLFRGGPTVNIGASTVNDREIVIDTDTDEIVVGSAKKRTVMKDTSGNVGIGTATPQRTLVVSDAGTEGFEFYPGSSAGNNTVNHYNRSTASFVNIITTADQHIFGRADGEKMRIDSSGNVKIGGTLPSAPNIELNSNGTVSVLTTEIDAFRLGRAGVGYGLNIERSGLLQLGTSLTGAGESVGIELNPSGSASFAAGVVVTGNDGSSGLTVNTTAAGKGIAVLGSTGGDIRLKGNGSATFSGTVTANGTVLTSDSRFKENITPANPQLADIEALGAQLKNFDWNADAPGSNDTRQLGLIAQDVEAVCPGIVKTIARTKQGAELTPETTDEEGNVTPATYEELDDSYKGISHDALIMKLLGAVAELSAKVEALENA